MIRENRDKGGGILQTFTINYYWLQLATFVILTTMYSVPKQTHVHVQQAYNINSLLD